MRFDNHRLPHLTAFARQPIVFLTTVTHERRPLLACRHALESLVEVWRHSPTVDGWHVGRFILMPDHVHLFARPALDAKPLSVWVQTWKSLASRRLASSSAVSPPVWQKDYFDRFLRSADSYQEKWRYVEFNPVRKGLCAEPAQWPWQGELFELRF